MSNLELACLLLGFGLLYSVTRIIRDFRRRDITPPRFHGAFGQGLGRFAQRAVRWDKAQTIKALAALIVGAVIAILVANYYPDYLPQGR